MLVGMRDVLFQRVLDDPDDREALAVLGDWLAEQGDPRGRFILTQLALEAPTLDDARRTALAAEEAALLEAHQRDWLGPLAGPLLDAERTGSSPKWRFARGFLDTLGLTDATVQVAEALGASEEARFLRSLSVEHCWDEDRALDLLAEASLPNVRRLRYGDGSGSIVEEGFAAALAAGMPRLEDLAVSGRRVETSRLFALKLPHLRSLSVCCAHAFEVGALASNASLARLEALELVPHAIEPGDEDGGYLTADHLRSIVRSPHLRGLERLTLQMCTAGDEGCRELVASGALGRLEELDLTYGEITDAGAEVLAGCPELGRLKRLVLVGNSLTERGVRALQATGVALVAGSQQQWQDREYLAFGDWE
jgi:uncharacterized protein (TIGR02996 family)